MKRFNLYNLLLIFLLLSGGIFVSPVLAAQTVVLTLEDATRLAVQESFDVQIARMDAKIAQTDALSAKSLYDLIMDVEALYLKDKSKKTTTILGTKSQDTEYNVGLAQVLPSGTTFNIELDNVRSSTNSSFATNTTTHESVFKASLTQDLGRNLFGFNDRSDIKVRLLDIESAEYSSLDRIEELMVSVQKAYLNVVLAQEQLLIEQDMLQTAERLYDTQKEKLETGLIEKPDLIAAEANLIRRQNNIKLVDNHLQEAKNVLKVLLALDVDDEIIIEERFVVSDETLTDAQSVVKAFDNRPDYKRLQKQLEAQDIKVKMKKQNLWPEINLTASYERNGLREDFPGSIENITEEDNPTYAVGVSVEFPFQNRDARAQLKSQKYQKMKLLASAKKLERQIVLNVTDKVRAVKVHRSIVQTSANVARLEASKLKEEEKRFSRGRSNTDTLIRFQEDAIQARLREAEAKYNYSLALVQLKREEGSLLAYFWDEEF